MKELQDTHGTLALCAAWSFLVTVDPVGFIAEVHSAEEVFGFLQSHRVDLEGLGSGCN